MSEANEAKHTAGPWEVYNTDRGSTWVRAVSGEHVTSLDSDVDADIAGNARLIAAAPDLLESLQIFVHAHASGNSVPPHIEARARTAIAKATGA